MDFFILKSGNTLNSYHNSILSSEKYRLPQVANSILLATGLLSPPPVMALTPDVNNTTVTGEIIYKGEVQNVNEGRIANDTLLNGMGYQQVTDNGTADNININDNGRQQLYAGISSNTIINDDGRLEIQKGSTAIRREIPLLTPEADSWA